jgi:DNA polymerase family B
LELDSVARRVQQPIVYEDCDVTIGRREAKRNPALIDAYLTQRGNSATRDMARRALGTRQFIAWDGEGYTDSEGVHHYMLFGASTGLYVQGESLGTRECLDLLLRVESENPDTFHVIFAGNYDVNMFLKDVDVETLTILKVRGQCKWRGYSIGYIRGKMFRVRKNGVTVTLYDVFTFFGTSFVKALEEYIGVEDEDVTRIRLGKADRSSFTYGDIDSVREYFESELLYLVRLCETLRRYLSEAGIRLSKWHGPGAVASTVLRTHRISRTPMREEISRAAQYGYSGGRFEQFKIGAHHGKVYQYDIRSAYPNAIATLPSLGSDWHHVVRPDVSSIRPYALYRVEYRANKAHRASPHPFPWRHKSGAVFYPPVYGDGWVWGIELRQALVSAPGRIRVSEGYELDDSGDRPFAWIAEMYTRRAQWKRDGRPAQLALKLAMNSVYGKLAQQVGWRPTVNGPKLPKFHQLEHAGFTTASTRAELYPALIQAGDSLIACETDAVYSSVPLDLNIGSGLGQWEETVYDGIVYVQSGMYFAKERDEWKYRTRGFSRADVSAERVLEWLSGMRTANDSISDAGFTVSQTRFRTIGTSIGKSDWRKWITSPRVITAGIPGGKREHTFGECASCIHSMGSLGDTLHTMVPAHSLKHVDYTVESTPYALEWLDEHTEWVEDEAMLDVWQDEVYR